jgi:hypothetical protein
MLQCRTLLDAILTPALRIPTHRIYLSATATVTQLRHVIMNGIGRIETDSGVPVLLDRMPAVATVRRVLQLSAAWSSLWSS